MPNPGVRRTCTLPAAAALTAVALTAPPALAATPGTYKGAGKPGGQITVKSGKSKVKNATLKWRVPCAGGLVFGTDSLFFKDMAIRKGGFNRGGEVLYPLGGFQLAEGTVTLAGRVLSKRKMRLTFKANIRIADGGETVDRCRGTIRFVAKR